MKTAVESVIYFYLFMCITLLVYNVLYTLRSHWEEKKKERRLSKWRAWLSGTHSEEELRESLALRLLRIDDLIAFFTALKEQLPDDAASAAFVRNNQRLMRTLALRYGRRSPMERAYFAYVVASFHAPTGEKHDILAEILLGYFEGSTVYCRENVLQALYALGNVQAVEHAFEIISEHDWYHSPKLLADGMMRYTGDKQELFDRLWKRRDRWQEYLLVGIVRFGMSLPENRRMPELLNALRSEQLPTEVRFALIRLFQRHTYAPAKEMLIRFMEDGRLAIAAASALAAYPGEDTRRVLLKALHSPNWYIRRNAAQTLYRLGIGQEDFRAIRESGDRYALEMLEYTTGMS